MHTHTDIAACTHTHTHTHTLTHTHKHTHKHTQTHTCVDFNIQTQIQQIRTKEMEPHTQAGRADTDSSLRTQNSKNISRPNNYPANQSGSEPDKQTIT